ncbi:MAG: DUF4286 family protein [Gemmatimonadaceae bacterium]
MPMLTYEITVTVRPDLCGEYERYMRDLHIPDLMQTGNFVAASFSRSAAGRYRIRYEARSREELDSYLEQHAPRLRQHFNDTFPAGVEVLREEWTVLEKWPPR